MAKEHSFDINANLDFQELKNAIDQAKREISTRYDFKGIECEFDLNEKEKILTFLVSTEAKTQAAHDILISKLVKRNLPLNALKETKKKGASGGKVKTIFTVIDSISSEEVKKIIKEIKTLKLKVNAINQKKSVRVSGKNINDLQTVMAHLKSLDFEAPLNFTNLK